MLQNLPRALIVAAACLFLSVFIYQALQDMLPWELAKLIHQ